MEERDSVTGSMLYDLEQCEHRPWMDRYGDPALREGVSPFVQMLWRRGRAHEEEVIAAEGVTTVPNLRTASLNKRERLTVEAMMRAVIETGPASVSEMPPPEVRLVCGGRLDDLAVRCRPVVGS